MAPVRGARHIASREPALPEEVPPNLSNLSGFAMDEAVDSAARELHFRNRCCQQVAIRSVAGAMNPLHVGVDRCLQRDLVRRSVTDDPHNDPCGAGEHFERGRNRRKRRLVPDHQMPIGGEIRAVSPGWPLEHKNVSEQLTVRDLVERGRFPHRGAFSRWTTRDRDAVDEALAATGTTEFADRAVDELSGGQRQRAWIAMVLAQQTPILLLDEPTTYLDLAYRLEVLRLLQDLNLTREVTVAMVLHDLDEACRFADHIIAMRDGAIVAQGPPEEIITPDLVHEVFGVSCITIPNPLTGTPLVIPT